MTTNPDYWDEPVYADVDREARQHWENERPPRVRAEDVLDAGELAAYNRRQR